MALQKSQQKGDLFPSFCWLCPFHGWVTDAPELIPSQSWLNLSVRTPPHPHTDDALQLTHNLCARDKLGSKFNLERETALFGLGLLETPPVVYHFCLDKHLVSQRLKSIALSSQETDSATRLDTRGPPNKTSGCSQV